MIVQVSKEKKEDSVAASVSEINKKIQEKQELRGKKKKQVDQEVKQLSEEEERLKKEALDKVREEIDNDDFHKSIIQNTMCRTFKHSIFELKGDIEYSYEYQNIREGIFDTIDRRFELHFVEHENSPNYYLLKIAGKKFTKSDLLTLYNAFRTVLKEKMDFLLSTYEKNFNSKKDKFKSQLELFQEDFREPHFEDIPISIYMNLGTKEEMTEIKFGVTRSKDMYAIRLNKDNYLTTQDIYFIYTNFDLIVNKLLNKVPKLEKDVA